MGGVRRPGESGPLQRQGFQHRAPRLQAAGAGQGDDVIRLGQGGKKQGGHEPVQPGKLPAGMEHLLLPFLYRFQVRKNERRSLLYPYASGNGQTRPVASYRLYVRSRSGGRRKTDPPVLSGQQTAERFPDPSHRPPRERSHCIKSEITDHAGKFRITRSAVVQRSDG